MGTCEGGGLGEGGRVPMNGLSGLANATRSLDIAGAVFLVQWTATGLRALAMANEACSGLPMCFLSFH